MDIKLVRSKGGYEAVGEEPCAHKMDTAFESCWPMGDGYLKKIHLRQGLDLYIMNWDPGSGLKMNSHAWPAGFGFKFFISGKMRYQNCAVQEEMFMTYVSLSQGYLAGGFNNTIDDPSAATYDPQTSTSYEWGAKTKWLDNRLTCNFALFYMDIEDMQVTEYPSAYVMAASNAGKAHSYGGELELKYRPVQGLVLNTALGLTQGEYDEYMGYGGVDYAGNKLKNTPEYSINVGVQYRHPCGFYSGLDVQGYGKTYFNESNKEASVRDSYAVVNLKLGMEVHHWDFYLYAKNLFDEEYFSSIFTSTIRNSYMVGSLEPSVPTLCSGFDDAAEQLKPGCFPVESIPLSLCVVDLLVEVFDHGIKFF